MLATDSSEKSMGSMALCSKYVSNLLKMMDWTVRKADFNIDKVNEGPDLLLFTTTHYLSTLQCLPLKCHNKSIKNTC